MYIKCCTHWLLLENVSGISGIVHDKIVSCEIYVKISSRYLVLVCVMPVLKSGVKRSKFDAMLDVRFSKGCRRALAKTRV